jgi:hypothetical protein
MSLLQPGEISDMQATAVAAMDSTCNILSASGAALNGAGGKSASKTVWNAIAGSPFPCRIWRQRDFAVNQQEAGTQQSILRFKASLPVGTAVATKMRLQVVGGPTYEVVGTDVGRTDPIQILCDIKQVS